MEKRLIQQGDVLFFEVESTPKGLTKVKNARSGLVTFAEGEATGHHHSCVADGVELMEDKEGTMWCVVEKESTVSHQEHGEVKLTPGTYKIGIVREVDPFADEIRNVAD